MSWLASNLLLRSRKMHRMATLIALVGLCIYVVGLAMPRYYDQEEFNRHYRSFQPKDAGASKAYQNLRVQFLTPSIKFQDYGITCMILAGFIFSASHWREIVASFPISGWTIIGVGMLAAGVTMAMFVGSLFLDAFRGEFPWWADSLGIPLMGAPFIFGALLVWVFINTGLLAMKWSSSVNWCQKLRGFCALVSMGVLTILLLISVVQGDFLNLLTVVAWFLFYGAIWKAIRMR